MSASLVSHTRETGSGAATGSLAQSATAHAAGTQAQGTAAQRPALWRSASAVGQNRGAAGERMEDHWLAGSSQRRLKSRFWAGGYSLPMVSMKASHRIAGRIFRFRFRPDSTNFRGRNEQHPGGRNALKYQAVSFRTKFSRSTGPHRNPENPHPSLGWRGCDVLCWADGALTGILS
jgi:hypothetical protein